MAKTKSAHDREGSEPKSAKKRKITKAERDAVAWNATIGQTMDYFFVGATKQERERADAIRKELLAVGQRVAGKSANSFNDRSLGMALAETLRQWAAAHGENLGAVPLRAPMPRKGDGRINQ